MESRKALLNSIAPRRIRAQAAVWVTELHGPDRNPSLEEKVRRWIAADPRHAAAFELATEAWQRSGNLPAQITPQTLAAARNRTRSRLLGPSLAGAAVLCGLLAAAAYYLPGRTLVTSAAEQRTVELADGTQVTLNANTRVRLQYDHRLRKVTLSRGEAFFHVAKLASKPFVVVAGNRKVIALGTSFLVRCEDPGSLAFAVTLVEGRVAVEPIGGPDLMPNDSAVGVESPSAVGKVLNRGERFRFAGDAPGVVDAPSIDKVTAWQRGLLIFDNTTLTAAAAEFNRYGSTKISITGVAAELRVSGVFGIGDSASFAQAMSLAYHLNVDNRGAEIILSNEARNSK
jgi:transmembrane sensor